MVSTIQATQAREGIETSREQADRAYYVVTEAERAAFVVELPRELKDLAGRVMVNFTISADGKVTESKIDKTTLRNEAAEKCIVEAVRTWEFPKPKGGIVTVTYPFLLAASGDDADKAKAANKK